MLGYIWGKTLMESKIVIQTLGHLCYLGRGCLGLSPGLQTSWQDSVPKAQWWVHGQLS